LEQQERLRHRDQEHHLTLLPPHLHQQLPSHLQQQPQQLLLQEDAQRQPPKELRYPVPRELQFRKMEDTGCWTMWQNLRRKYTYLVQTQKIRLNYIVLQEEMYFLSELQYNYIVLQE
jgi:hypothetical protein